MAGTVMTHPDGSTTTANNPRAIRAMQKQGYVVGKTAPKKKEAFSTEVSSDVYKPGYDVQDFKKISFKDYQNIKNSANKPSQGFIGNIFGQGQRLRDDVDYIEKNNMIIPETPVTKAAVFNNEANNRAIVKQMNDLDGFIQRQMRNNSTSGKTEQFGQNDGRIVKTDPVSFLPKGLTPKTVPEKSTYGFHNAPFTRKDGTTGKQTFKTQNEKDPYWDDYVKGTGDGFSHAELKNKPKQEVDTQAIKNWLSSMFG
jgi:hypothetical protein